jgi:hypothetical protein
MLEHGGCAPPHVRRVRHAGWAAGGRHHRWSRWCRSCSRERGRCCRGGETWGRRRPVHYCVDGVDGDGRSAQTVFQGIGRVGFQTYEREPSQNWCEGAPHAGGWWARAPRVCVTTCRRRDLRDLQRWWDSCIARPRRVSGDRGRCGCMQNHLEHMLPLAWFRCVRPRETHC